MIFSDIILQLLFFKRAINSTKAIDMNVDDTLQKVLSDSFHLRDNWNDELIERKRRVNQENVDHQLLTNLLLSFKEQSETRQKNRTINSDDVCESMLVLLACDMFLKIHIMSIVFFFEERRDLVSTRHRLSLSKQNRFDHAIDRHDHIDTLQTQDAQTREARRHRDHDDDDDCVDLVLVVREKKETLLQCFALILHLWCSRLLLFFDYYSCDKIEWLCERDVNSSHNSRESI